MSNSELFPVSRKKMDKRKEDLHGAHKNKMTKKSRKK